jgi:hypothetical protein
MQSLGYRLKTSFLSRTLLLLMLSFNISAKNIESEKIDILVIEGAAYLPNLIIQHLW